MALFPMVTGGGSPSTCNVTMQGTSSTATSYFHNMWKLYKKITITDQDGGATVRFNGTQVSTPYTTTLPENTQSYVSVQKNSGLYTVTIEFSEPR